ncbi:MAG: TRAP transporter large permease subunit, partial [Quisquiliibacterium sp.]
AVTIGPALVQGGLDKLAVHLFLMYWGMISFITPPVALGAYAAASIAQSNPMKTGFEAMRLGSIIYFVPFFFVLNPALIGQDTIGEILLVLTAAMFGILFISAGLQGYLYFVGPIDGNPVMAMAGRALLVAAGLILALPGNEKILGFNHTQINLTALALAVVAIGLCSLGKRRGAEIPRTG